MADKKTKKVIYSEPAEYFPKEIRDKLKKSNTSTPAKKKTVKKKK